MCVFIQQVKEAMFGPPNCTVTLKMQRVEGSVYEVVAMRHMTMTKEGFEEMNCRNVSPSLAHYLCVCLCVS
jgi:hypothetical protein